MAEQELVVVVVFWQPDLVGIWSRLIERRFIDLNTHDYYSCPWSIGLFRTRNKISVCVWEKSLRISDKSGQFFHAKFFPAVFFEKSKKLQTFKWKKKLHISS